MLNASVLLFLAIVLDYIVNKKSINKKDIILLLLLSIIIATIKIVYLFVLLLLILLPKETFKEIKLSKTIFVPFTIIVSIIIALAWNKISSVSNPEESLLISKQLNFILSNPIEYLVIFFKTFTEDFYYYLTNLVAGNEMCLAVVKINGTLVIGYFSLLIYSYFFDKNNVKISNMTKHIIWLIFIIIVGGIATIMYITWTITNGGIGLNKIVGFQSRYLIILIPILMLTFPNIKKIAKNQNLLWTGCIVLNGIILLETIGSLITFYFNLL